MKKLREIFNAIFRRRQNRNNAPQNQPDNASEASTNHDIDVDNTAPTKRQLGKGRFDEIPEFENLEVNNQEKVYTKRQLGKGRFDEMPEFENLEANNQEKVYTKRQLGKGRFDGTQEQPEAQENRESIDIDRLINEPPTRRASTGSSPSVLNDSSSTLSRASKTSKRSDALKSNKKRKPSF